MYTPWGESQSVETLGDGIIAVTTASHGGIFVFPEKNQTIHSAWRTEDGWYEEDCKWAIVAHHFPDLFTAEIEAIAKAILKDAFPYEYMEVTGEKLLPEDSYRLREDVFLQVNKDKYIVSSAWGDWHHCVPKGFVGVCAYKGGWQQKGDRKSFLVPAEEYDKRGINGFVIDEARHQAVADFAK